MLKTSKKFHFFRAKPKLENHLKKFSKNGITELLAICGYLLASISALNTLNGELGTDFRAG